MLVLSNPGLPSSARYYATLLKYICDWLAGSIFFGSWELGVDFFWLAGFWELEFGSWELDFGGW